MKKTIQKFRKIENIGKNTYVYQVYTGIYEIDIKKLEKAYIDEKILNPKNLERKKVEIEIDFH